MATFLNPQGDDSTKTPSPQGERGMSTKTKGGMPAHAIPREAIPADFREIIDGQVALDKRLCLCGEQVATGVGGLSSEAFALTQRAYVDGEFWPRIVPRDVASEAVVSSLLLDPARPADRRMIRDWQLARSVQQPCLLRICAWPGQVDAWLQILPLTDAEAEVYRSLWSRREVCHA